MKTFFFIFSWWIGVAGSNPTAQYIAYIEQYRLLAMQEQNRTGIPAAITMAQALHESGAGQGELALQSNNHFGIKCKNNWTGNRVFHDDDASGECFRAYPSVYDSYKDHSDFLKAGSRYAFLFDIEISDYKAWAVGLKRAGYATNPKYADILIKTIEDNNLAALTMQAAQLVDTTVNDEFSDTLIDYKIAVKETTDNVALQPANIESDIISKPLNNYPSNVFMINNCKVLFVKEETALLALAQQHKLSLGDLLRYNDMSSDQILVSNQLVFLEKKKTSGQSAEYVAKSPQTLWEISQVNGIRLSNLKALNPNLSTTAVVNLNAIIYLQKPEAKK